ncbi:Apc13 domain protein [Cordyceps fumosorosea ARSEF 2679]|uniref:Apc13 domain protein n=1 Tax=Cordyceps fumosorosea (strain ARSEF 2679) TaxID=1081104 RepID=A0A162JQ06_CORFA|nr:Apc13 domain protein [Cordyceps fumosorosea ARSEF 2679]OAA45363.1 Apc13 domain protein [Cordyceps fumosorosea ARSEF 2679]
MGALTELCIQANHLPQNKDSHFTYVHMHRAADADLFDDFCRDKLPDDEIYVPPQHQPINPEDEDDVVPDQHAAFGIQRATQRVNEPAWKDLGLASLMDKGPDASGKKGGGKGAVGVRNLPR